MIPMLITRFGAIAIARSNRIDADLGEHDRDVRIALDQVGRRPRELATHRRSPFALRMSATTAFGRSVRSVRERVEELLMVVPVDGTTTSHPKRTEPRLPRTHRDR